jgi:glycosyltransferase involved in cell wall biosynthesis
MVSGFSIVKNGEVLGYPYLEALESLAAVVDELVVAHGDSSDDTFDQLKALQSRIKCPMRILDSPWDAKNLQGGSELARQTNVALDACSHDVCVYLQADELFDNDEFNMIREDLARFATDGWAQALVFRYLHFFGSPDYVVESRKWYRREIRAIKRSTGLRSFRDGQGFRIISASGNSSKPNALLSRATVRHYGWVRPPNVMAKKSEALDRLWHGAARDGTHQADAQYPMQFGVRRFTGRHPEAMLRRFSNFEYGDPFEHQRVNRFSKDYIRCAVGQFFEKAFDWRPGEFTNYGALRKIG